MTMVVVMTTMVVAKLVMAMMTMMMAVMMMEMVAVTLPVTAVTPARCSPLYVEGADARNHLRKSFSGSFNG